jgi:hypothetical protein
MSGHEEMNGTAGTRGSQPGGPFDDERLLAYAMGLDDDPGLAAAAANDGDLRRRLEALRAEAGAVGDAVRAAVPAPDDSYTDLGDPRWARLSEHFEPPAAPARASRAGSRGRSRLWLRVLAPAAAVALALAVGVAALQRDGWLVDRETATDQALETETSGGVTGAESAPGDAAKGDADGLASPLDGFAVVALARAGAPSGDSQAFEVLRVLRGTAPDAVRLQLVDDAAVAGTLHLLCLDPPADLGRRALDEAVAAPPMFGGEADEPAATGGPMVYRYDGRPAVALPLPPGTDPAGVRLD